MSSRPKKRDRTASAEIEDPAAMEAEIERYLATHHQDVEAKLATARASILRGDVAPLEPLQHLLRQARRSSKRVR